MKSFKAILTRVRTLSQSTRDFRFIREDGGALEFAPGQFYRFVFSDEQGEFERSYSLCNFADDADGKTMDLVISTVDGGRASRLLFAASPGLETTVTGPYGRLVLPDTLPQRLFLVATSVGIAPYLPMLNQLRPALNEDQCEVHLLYGVRDYSEFIYGDFLNDFSSQYAAFNLHLCLSRCDLEAGQTESQFKGYVQDKLQALLPNPDTDLVMLCGNPHMIDQTYPSLKELGFKVKQVVREKYVFAKDKVPVESKAASMSAEQMSLLAEKMKKYQK